ncbi:MAG: DUF4440 domain-containing protein [Gemmatimonadaceae bacterium]
MFRRRKLVIGYVIVALGLSGCATAPRVDPQTEEQAIRDLGRQWQQAAASKDVAAIMRMYAPDAVFAPPNMALAKDSDAIRAAWAGLFEYPNLSLTFGPTRIEVAQSGDLAYETGTYRLAFDGPQGRVEDEGNYAVAWKKVGGQWKAVSDVVTSSKPLPPAPQPAVDVVIIETGEMEIRSSGGVQWTDLDVPGFAPGMKLAVLHGDPSGKGDYTVRLKFPPKYEFPAHWHPMAEHVTVLSGTFNLGMGDSFNRTATKPYQPGDLLYIPPKMSHFGWVGGETVIQLHGVGPFTINLTKPAQ